MRGRHACQCSPHTVLIIRLGRHWKKSLTRIPCVPSPFSVLINTHTGHLYILPRGCHPKGLQKTLKRILSAHGSSRGENKTARYHRPKPADHYNIGVAYGGTDNNTFAATEPLNGFWFARGLGEKSSTEYYRTLQMTFFAVLRTLYGQYENHNSGGVITVWPSTKPTAWIR